MTSIMCSWCHRLNAIGTPRCQCGHNPFRARIDCDCDYCRQVREDAESRRRVQGALRLLREEEEESDL